MSKASYVGAPAIFLLERECRLLNEAFGDGHPGCYLVGSSLVKPDWRDVDIRFIMPDDEFEKLFPDAERHWEFDQRWLIMTASISLHLSKVTGLPIDFQFQKQSHANARYDGLRHPMGMSFVKSGV